MVQAPRTTITHTIPFMYMQGMAIPQEVLDKISAENLEATFTKAEGAGLNPVQLFNSLIHHPDLLAKLRDPRVMSAFMDVTKTPSNLAKYQSEPEIVEVRPSLQADGSTVGGYIFMVF